MKIVKKLFISLLTFFVVLIFSSPFWTNRVRLKNFNFLVGKLPAIDKYLCWYSVKVTGDSMSPIIASGSSIELNRCFDESDLSEGTVVLFGKKSDYHLGIIRHIVLLDPTVYKISNERPNERLQDVVVEEIKAVNNKIDTSRSIYQPQVNPETFILNPEEYVKELYLGKIPKGYGVEITKVKKTNIFSKNKDKFCMVVIPKKELAFVDVEIIDANTKEIVFFHKDIVFAVRSKPNTNCQDFGIKTGMLNLNEGHYRYRFLLNHQALADILFIVK